MTAQLRTARLCFTISIPGRHWVSNALAVLAAVEAVGGDLAQAGLSLAEMTGLPGRGARRKVRTADGGEALLIDEAYNANPASMAATLHQLSEEKGNRRIAVLGAMKELGSLSDRLHAGLADAVKGAQEARLRALKAQLDKTAKDLEQAVARAGQPTTRKEQ